MTIPARAAIAPRLLRLLLRPNGSIPGPRTISLALRAAVLFDLALSGAIERNGDEGYYLDTTPTGSPSADAMLAAVVADPIRTMAHWLGHGPVDVGSVSRDLVNDETWSCRPGLRRRWVDHRADEVETDRTRIRAALLGARPDSPQTAALTALLIATGAVVSEYDIPAVMLLDCGSNALMVEEITALVAEHALLANAVARFDGLAGTGAFID